MAFTQEQLDRFRTELLKERKRIEADRAAYSGEVEGETQQEHVDDLADYDPNDPSDEGSNLYDRDRDLAAVENAERLLTKIDRALAKIDDGTYGLSDIDGTPIPVERLEAIPYAVTTVEQEEEVI